MSKEMPGVQRKLYKTGCMQIGIDIRNIGKQRTGDEKVFLHLIQALAKLNAENTYILCSDERTEAEKMRLRNMLGVEGRKNFHIVFLGSGNKFLWNAWVVPRAVRKFALDIYHTQYIVPFFLPKSIKVVTHVHDISFKVFPKLISVFDRFFLALLMPRSLKRADMIIAVSQFTKDEIVSKYDVFSEKIQVIPNAVSSGFEKTGEFLYNSAVKQIRARYHLPEKYIAYVGTFQPRKNIPALLRAFAKLRERIADAKLVLIGNRQAHHTDPEIDRCIKSLRIEKDVLFPGYVSDDDLPSVVRLASVFVYPSIYEGFGMPILEAMSQCVPVIASDIAPHHEVAGDSVRYFSYADIDSLTEILYDVCTNEVSRKQSAKNGYSRSLLFSWEKSALKLLKLYKKLDSGSNL